MSRALAHALSPDGSLTCVDISEYWTGKAKRRLKSFSNIRFLPGDITQMDLPAASFDAAVIHYALHDIEPGARGDVMDAIAETLRPEGSLFIREPGHPSHGIPLPEIRNLTLCAGFRELHAGCKRSLIWRSVCNGQFLKSW
jgi:ubiquinone/menaquinone biosynthesis C-methylase UbiE